MLYLIVKLYARPDALEALRAYERRALDLFRRHGGELVIAFAPEPGPADADWPDEIHVLRITDHAQYRAFLADPDRQALAAERDAAIRKAEIFLSRASIPY